MYAFIPNIPGSIFAAPPTSKARLTERSLFEPLPHAFTAAQQIGMVHLLSEPTENPVGVLFAPDLRRQPRDRADWDRFETALQTVADAIEARHSYLAVPYNYLHPATLYPSIEI